VQKKTVRKWALLDYVAAPWKSTNHSPTDFFWIKVFVLLSYAMKTMIYQKMLNKKGEGSYEYTIGAVRWDGLFVWLHGMVTLDGWVECMV
jgi:hypothetical protein